MDYEKSEEEKQRYGAWKEAQHCLESAEKRVGDDWKIPYSMADLNGAHSIPGTKSYAALAPKQMQKTTYGEKLSIIVRDRGYQNCAVRYLTDRLEMQKVTPDFWQVSVDTADIPISVLDGVENILDFTAFCNGQPVAMGSVEVAMPEEQTLTLDPVEA
jgi:hypothetical protein